MVIPVLPNMDVFYIQSIQSHMDMSFFKITYIEQYAIRIYTLCVYTLGLLAHLLFDYGWGGWQVGLTTEPEDMVGALSPRDIYIVPMPGAPVDRLPGAPVDRLPGTPILYPAALKTMKNKGFHIQKPCSLLRKTWFLVVCGAPGIYVIPGPWIGRRIPPLLRSSSPLR